MKHFHLKSCLLSAILLTVSFGATAQVNLKIARGDKDTVFSSKHYVVGITDPGCKATVNGEEVKVYENTGAFGAEVMLSEGDNPINVTVTKGGKSESKDFSVYYKAGRQPRPERLMTMDQARREIDHQSFKERDFYGESVGNAYLQWGDGDDRLGGSKIGYIEEGIVMHIVGEKGDLYKVQLSQNRYAFIDRENIRPTDKKTEVINTGSWSVTNTGKRDRVYINLGRKLPYAAWTQLDPTTICVDIYGAMNNSNWITQRDELGIIDYVDWRQVDSDVFRVIIKLKEKYFWGFSVGYERNNMVITVRHRPDQMSLKGMKIGLDAGHGGPSSLGAVSVTGINEKDVNLDIVYHLKAMLEAKGATVVLSRPDDREVSMAERRKFFKDEDVDLMVSVHNNAGGSPLVPMGTSTYYKHIANRDMAKCVFNRMMELGFPSFGVTGNFNFSLGTPTDYPNILVEGLFMSSLVDENFMATDANRKVMANKILLGIEDYLKMVDASLDKSSRKKK